ncbi:MAG TPA: CHAD domain-containing protein [Streptosporangiaceae bacterium]|nr:CHAD domain-containing protein [Streptosporangiaceae bacterium]
MVEAPSHDFVIGESAEPVTQALRKALAPRFTVVADARPHTRRHTWLETFDWRLQRAGMTLEYVTGRGCGELVLTSTDGERVSVPAQGLRWPALADTLPDGLMRARVGAVASVRALLPTAEALSTVRRLRACNADEKTIAWLTVDHARAIVPTAAGLLGANGLHPPAGPAGDLPTRLTVTPVRGYGTQADRIAARLADTHVGQPALATPFQAALAVARRWPGDYSGKLEARLDAAMPARLAMVTVLADLLTTLETNVPGTLRDVDTEFLHDLRVAVRRTRTALKLGAAALPAEVVQHYQAEFKWLGDVTTPTRDLDVYLLDYPAMADSLVGATPADLAPFHDYLVRRRAAERRHMARTLRSARFASLTSTWRTTLTGMPPGRAGRSAAQLARDTLAKAQRRVLAGGDAITSDSPPESLHDLRKRCKELRYALEFFASLCDPAGYRQAVRGLKGLQDCLGAYQDSSVQHEEIRVMAAQMMASHDVPADTLLALGELAGEVARQGHDARREFAGRFAEFAALVRRTPLRTLVTGVPR